MAEKLAQTQAGRILSRRFYCRDRGIALFVQVNSTPRHSQLARIFDNAEVLLTHAFIGVNRERLDDYWLVDRRSLAAFGFQSQRPCFEPPAEYLKRKRVQSPRSTCGALRDGSGC
jgi:hypothetical protein